MLVSWWVCKTSQPGVSMTFVPTNATSGLDVLQDFYHPHAAVVGVRTSHSHAGFKANRFSLVPREHRSILRTVRAIIGFNSK